MKKKIGTKIKLAREAKGLNQAALATLIKGVTQQQISNWESGKHSPNLKFAPKLQEHLDLSLQDLGFADTGFGPDTAPPKTLLGTRLKDSRTKANKTPEQVQADLRIHIDSLLEIEVGAVEIDSESLEKLAKYYGTTVDEITKGIPAPGEPVSDDPIPDNEIDVLALEMVEWGTKILKKDADANTEDQKHLMKAIQQTIKKMKENATNKST